LYITKAELKNFQSHKHTLLDLEEGINVIAGESDQGKSSVYKAFDWVFNNKVNGDRPSDSITSNWAKSTTKAGATSYKQNTEVEFTFSNGIKVKRIKGKENKYILTTPDETREFTGNGQNVPNEIKDAIKLSYLNQAPQHEAYFILFDSPGQIAQKINEIVDLSLGDDLLKIIKSESRATNSKVKVYEEEKGTKEEELKEYSYIDKMESDFNSLTIKHETMESVEAKLNKCVILYSDLVEIESQLKQYSNLESKGSSLNKLLNDLEGISSLNKRINSIDSYLVDVEYLSNEMKIVNQITIKEAGINKLLDLFEKHKKMVDKYNDVVYTLDKLNSLEEEIKRLPSIDRLEKVNSLIEDCDRIDLLEKRCLAIDECLAKVVALSREKKELDNFIKDKEEKFHTAMSEFDVCPLCGRS